MRMYYSAVPIYKVGTSDSMTIRWRTDTNSTYSLQYGTDLVAFPDNTMASKTATCKQEEHNNKSKVFGH